MHSVSQSVSLHSWWRTALQSNSLQLIVSIIVVYSRGLAVLPLQSSFSHFIFAAALSQLITQSLSHMPACSVALPTAEMIKLLLLVIVVVIIMTSSQSCLHPHCVAIAAHTELAHTLSCGLMCTLSHIHVHYA